MAWTKKSSAPATFNLSQAFLALVTGDATWGWLADWLQFIPQAVYDTPAFCASGPIITAPLVATDFIPTFNVTDPRQAIHTASLITLLTAAARDRVFGAYCETVGPVVGGWGDWQEITNQGILNSHVEVDVHKPTGATSAQVEIIDSHWGTGPSDGVNLTQIHNPPDGSQNTYYGPTKPTVVGEGPGTNATLSLSNWPDMRFQTISDAYLHARIRYNVATVTPYTPTAQPQPAGVISPLGTVDPSLAGIATELERHETKLDFLLQLLQYVAGATLDLGGPAADPVDLVADTPMAVADAVGCVITSSSIPASRSLDFGTPQNVVKLGHINLGTASAWYPSIWLTHSPMVIRPFPPGTTRVTVTDLPPGVTCTIALISRTK